MVTLKQEIPASIKVRAQMDDAGELALTVQVSAPYGTPVDKKSGEHICSARVEDQVPGELRTRLKEALDAIRAHTEAHCALTLQRAIILSRETALRLGEIKEA